MKQNERKAFNKLAAMGCPVIERPVNDPEAPFVISGENNDDRIWACYYAMEYGEFGIALDVCTVLRENGLFAEWINPGIAGVYQA